LQLAGLWLYEQNGIVALPMMLTIVGHEHPEPGLEGIARVHLEAEEGDPTFTGHWLDRDGNRLLSARFRLRRAGTAPTTTSARNVPAVVSLVPHDVDPKPGVERLAGHRAASRLAWQTALTDLALGWLGSAAEPEPADPEPGRPVRLDGRSVHWSRSHCDRWAAAAVMPDRLGRVGIDIESVETRAPSFWREITNSAERKRFGDRPDPETVVRIWTVKEAVLKALGTGLGLPLATVEIHDLDRRSAVFGLTGRGADTARAASLSMEGIADLDRPDRQTSAAVAWLPPSNDVSGE